MALMSRRSLLGHSRGFLRVNVTSGYPPKLTVRADIQTGSLDQSHPRRCGADNASRAFRKRTIALQRTVSWQKLKEACMGQSLK